MKCEVSFITGQEVFNLKRRGEIRLVLVRLVRVVIVAGPSCKIVYFLN